MTKSTWGGKGLFSLHFHTAVHHQRKSELELKQVMKQELMKRSRRDVLYWLASTGFLSLFSYRIQDYHQPRDDPTHKWPFSLDHQLRKCLRVVSHGGISSTEAPFSVITPSCVKLTHKTKQYIYTYKLHDYIFPYTE